MTDFMSDRMSAAVAAMGIALTSLAYALSGPIFALGTGVGAAIALVNWLIILWIVRRVIGSPSRSQAGFMLLLVGKMGALMAFVYVILRQGWVEPTAFVLGVSALFAGLVVGSIRHVLTATTPVEDKP